MKMSGATKFITCYSVEIVSTDGKGKGGKGAGQGLGCVQNKGRKKGY